jgi:hypothetical protein
MTNEEILESNGWQIDCESPFEISHEDGSFATLNAANIVLQSFKEYITHSNAPIEIAKHYFFTDRQVQISNNKTHLISGYVESFETDAENPRPSGKDMSVIYLQPFEGVLKREWRAFDEVELFEADEWDYNIAVDNYKNIYPEFWNAISNHLQS